MDQLANQVEARLMALNATKGSGTSLATPIMGGCWPVEAVSNTPYPHWTVTPVSLAAVHYFTGAPKNEAKNLPCGVALTTKRIGGGFMLVGVQATTDINEVTCLSCLRSLIAKGK